jgi:hypothetical protein
VYFHTQNLTKEDGKKKSIFWHGRAWWRPTIWASFHSEWKFGGHCNTAAGFTIADDDHDLQIHLAVNYLFAIWFDFSLAMLHDLFHDLRQVFGYRTDICFHSESLWIHFAYSEGAGCRTYKNPWFVPGWISIWVGGDLGGGISTGFYLTIHYLDFILGKRIYSTELVGPLQEIQIPVAPDTTILGRFYYANCQMERATWRRARWFPEVVMRATVDFNPPIPVAGKGESDWDIGDDAVHAGTYCASDVKEAIQVIAADIARSRSRHGLPDSIVRELTELNEYR